MAFTNGLRGISNSTVISIGVNSGTTATGVQNTFIGIGAGSSVTTGQGHTLIGNGAGGALTTNSFCTIVGANAGNVNTAGSNTFFGSSAGNANTTGGGNTFIGNNAGLANIGGAGGTYVGDAAGDAATGDANTLIGQAAGGAITSGINNTAVGNNAANTLVGGSNCVAIGKQALTGSATDDGIAIGSGAQAVNDDAIAIGSGAITTGTRQIVIGSSTNQVLKMYMGNGVTNASPSSVSYNGVGASGANVGGGEINISGGQSTGTGLGGNVVLQASFPSAPGSSLNSLSDILTATPFGPLMNKTVSYSLHNVNDADYTVDTDDNIIHVSALTTGRTITLPDMTNVPPNTSPKYVIKDSSGGAGTNNITVDGNSSDTIDGAATKVIAINYGYIELYWNGSEWMMGANLLA